MYSTLLIFCSHTRNSVLFLHNGWFIDKLVLIWPKISDFKSFFQKFSHLQSSPDKQNRASTCADFRPTDSSMMLNRWHYLPDDYNRHPEVSGVLPGYGGKFESFTSSKSRFLCLCCCSTFTSVWLPKLLFAFRIRYFFPEFASNSLSSKLIDWCIFAKFSLRILLLKPAASSTESKFSVWVASVWTVLGVELRKNGQLEIDLKKHFRTQSFTESWTTHTVRQMMFACPLLFCWPFPHYSN